MTWERMIEALHAIGLEELAKTVREKFCSPSETEEVPKPADESIKEKAGGRDKHGLNSSPNTINLFFSLSRCLDTSECLSTLQWYCLRLATVALRS